MSEPQQIEKTISRDAVAER